jgi:hypothetical protein
MMLDAVRNRKSDFDWDDTHGVPLITGINHCSEVSTGIPGVATVAGAVVVGDTTCPNACAATKATANDVT